EMERGPETAGHCFDTPVPPGDRPLANWITRIAGDEVESVAKALAGGIRTVQTKESGGVLDVDCHRVAGVGAVLVGCGGADRVNVRRVRVDVRHGWRIAQDRFDSTVAPGDGPLADRVRAWVRGRKVQDVGGILVDLGIAAEGQGRGNVEDVDGDGV